MAFPCGSQLEFDALVSRWNDALSRDATGGDPASAVIAVSDPAFRLEVTRSAQGLRVSVADAGIPADVELTAENLHKVLAGVVNLMLLLNRRVWKGSPALAFLLETEPALARAYRAALGTGAAGPR